MEGSSEEQIVSSVEKVRVKKGRKEWFVHWNDGSKSWEPLEHLVDEDGTKTIHLIKFECKEEIKQEKVEEQEQDM